MAVPPLRLGLLLVLLLATYQTCQGAPRSHAPRSTAIVLTYIEPPPIVANDTGPLYDAVRVMVHWLVSDPLRCVCTDVVVLTCSKIQPEHKFQLEQDGAIVVEVSNPGFRFNGFEKRWQSTWAKLVTVNLTRYDRVIVLDSDMVLLDRVDSLFEWADENLAPSCSIGGVANVEFNPADTSGFNSGLLLIEPNAEDFEALVRMGREKAYPGDQDLYNHYFRTPPKRWCKIPIRYHRFPSYRWPSRMDPLNADDVVAHGAAWRGNLRPDLAEVWNLGLMAVKQEDNLRRLFEGVGKSIPIRRWCAHCIVGRSKANGMVRARMRNRASERVAPAVPHAE